MSRFCQLLRRYGPDQMEVERRFPDEVARSHFRHWSPGDPIRSSGLRYLIGVATYSEYDLRLLDLLEEAMISSAPAAHHRQRHPAAVADCATIPSPSPQVDIFSVGECRTQADFEKYIPGLETVFQTPVVGVWRDGVLQKKGSGAQARQELVVEPFALDWASQRWAWERLIQP